MIPEFFYFDELADPSQAAEMPDLCANTAAEIRWQPEEIARLRSQMATDNAEKMPHEKIKS